MGRRLRNKAFSHDEAMAYVGRVWNLDGMGYVGEGNPEGQYLCVGAVPVNCDGFSLCMQSELDREIYCTFTRFDVHVLEMVYSRRASVVAA